MNDDYIARKERWARKMASQPTAPPERSAERLPPGQRQVTNFPTLDLLGFWELRGYSNTADPWTNGRFAPNSGTPP